MKNLKISLLMVFAFLLFSAPAFAQGITLKDDLPPQGAMYLKIKNIKGEAHSGAANGIQVNILDWGQTQMSPIKLAFPNKTDAERLMRQFSNGTTLPSVQIMIKSREGDFEVDLTRPSSNWGGGDLDGNGTVEIANSLMLKYQSISIRRI